MITLELLRYITGAPMKQHVAQGVVDHFPQAMWDYEIRTPEQVAHFLAQCAHESANYTTIEEFASGRGYEGRKDLGNTVAGYGVKYKGRSHIQCTGFYNYKAMTEELGVDLINNPQLLSTDHELAAYASAAWWWKNNVNGIIARRGNIADQCKRVTKRINGGYNGLEDRQAKTTRAFHKIDEIMDGIFDDVDKTEPTE